MFREYRKAVKSGATQQAIKIRDKIFIQHRNLARDVAHREANGCPEPYEDLEQIASEGLLRAIAKFDPDRGVSFSSFAVPYIRGEIQHFLRDNYDGGPKVPRREIELSSRAIKLTKACGIELDETIVARGLKVSAQKLRNSMEARSRKPVKSLDEIVHEPSDEGGIVEQDYGWVRNKVAMLPEPYQGVIIDRYLRGIPEQKIARNRGVKLAIVQSQIEMGLMKLRKVIPEEDARSFGS